MIVSLALAYIVVGLLFGLFFAVRGAKLLDPVAEGSPLSFRIMIFPAAVALWPLLLFKLAKNAKVAA